MNENKKIILDETNERRLLIIQTHNNNLAVLKKSLWWRLFLVELHYVTLPNTKSITTTQYCTQYSQWIHLFNTKL